MDVQLFEESSNQLVSLWALEASEIYFPSFILCKHIREAKKELLLRVLVCYW